MTSTNEKAVLDVIYNKGNWVDFAQDCRMGGHLTIKLQNAFHLLWVEKGHFIRSRLNDDKQLLNILRLLLPPYEGEGKWLFRGENRGQYEKERIGFCWTAKEDTARMFARGFNAYGSGGVLLKAWAPTSAILADVHSHSEYLDENEITVDGSSVEQLQALEYFPATH